MSQRQRHEAAERRRRRIRWAVVAAVAAVIALGGILFFPVSDPEPAVEVSMVEYAFAPTAAAAEPGQDLAITNDGAISHSYLIVDLAKGTEVAPGEEGALTIPDDATAGTYRVICDLPGHVEEGMVGTLEIK
jgi:plastocyanin